jgi:hypothetical protein
MVWRSGGKCCPPLGNRGWCRVMNHHVRLIGQNDLPAGTDWALAEVEGRMIAFLTPAALTEAALGEVWAAYRLLAPPTPPTPRMGSSLLQTV